MTGPVRPVALDGGRALVTGASSGIGQSTAQALADHGVAVALAGRDESSLADLARRTGGSVFVGDLTRPGYPAQLVEEVTAASGPLDMLIANAGAGWCGPFASMPTDEIDHLVDLNFRAPLQLARAVVPGMVAKGRGHIVLVGSIAGLVGVPEETAYSATKSGLAGLADALRAELAGTGVKVSLVSPGVVDTPFLHRRNKPYRRSLPAPLPPDEVASAIIDCLRYGRPEAVIPGWLSVAARLHGVAPRAYWALAHRFG